MNWIEEAKHRAKAAAAEEIARNNTKKEQEELKIEAEKQKAQEAQALAKKEFESNFQFFIAAIQQYIQDLIKADIIENPQGKVGHNYTEAQTFKEPSIQFESIMTEYCDFQDAKQHKYLKDYVDQNGNPYLHATKHDRYNPEIHDIRTFSQVDNYDYHVPGLMARCGNWKIKVLPLFSYDSEENIYAFNMTLTVFPYNTSVRCSETQRIEISENTRDYIEDVLHQLTEKILIQLILAKQ